MVLMISLCVLCSFVGDDLVLCLCLRSFGISLFLGCLPEKLASMCCRKRDALIESWYAARTSFDGCEVVFQFPHGRRYRARLTMAQKRLPNSLL